MNPNDLEWLKEQKKYPRKKQVIKINVEQTNPVLQPVQPAQPNQGETGITRSEITPKKVYRLFLAFLKRTLSITKRGTIFEFHVSGGEDYTIIIDNDMLYITSDDIEKVKSDIGIPEENVVFTQGELTEFPVSGITQLVLQGMNSQMILQYQPGQGMTVFIEIGGEIIVINGKITGEFKNE